MLKFGGVIQNEVNFVRGAGMALKVFRERSGTALHSSGSMVPCIIGEKLFRHSLGTSPPSA